jgi:hypothetical protein
MPARRLAHGASPARRPADQEALPMDLFLQIVLSFPTLLFSVALMVALGFWLLAMLGLFELNVLDLAAADGVEVDAGGSAGLLMKFGFDGLPVTLILTGIAFFAWLLSYAGSLLLFGVEPGPLRVSLAVAVAIGAFLLAIPFAGLALRPLRGLFARNEAPPPEALLARSAVVRSPDVTSRHGTAYVDDGGAGLILQVRADPGQFRRGDTVVLVDYLPAQNAYRVIAAGDGGRPPPV